MSTVIGMRLSRPRALHDLRLQLAERDLSSFAPDRRRRIGRATVRQIDLERQRLGRELHTGVGQTLVAIETSGDCAILTIRDDGVGFEVAGLLRGPASVASGIGLRSIREQAAALGGRSEIQSTPVGTTLVVSVPFS